jgi:hypothetical protein
MKNAFVTLSDLVLRVYQADDANKERSDER